MAPEKKSEFANNWALRAVIPPPPNAARSAK